MKKQALILVNPYPNVEAESYQPKRLAEEFARLGVEVDILPNYYRASIKGGNVLLRLEKYDFCVYLDKDKYTHRMLERSGMRLFNSADAVEICDDKMTTAIMLSNSGIPMPETLPAPLCYKPDADIDGEAERVLDVIPLPVVVKKCYGSLGKEVYLARTREELQVLMKAHVHAPHLYQRFVEESSGKDLRVVCVGGEVVASMKRTSDTDFRSNISLGGRGEPFTPTDEVRTLCKRVSEILKLDYCGIDLLFGKDSMLVCEVNSNAFFGGIEAITGANVAKAYAEHICKIMYQN